MQTLCSIHDDEFGIYARLKIETHQRFVLPNLYGRWRYPRDCLLIRQANEMMAYFYRDKETASRKDAEGYLYMARNGAVSGIVLGFKGRDLDGTNKSFERIITDNPNFAPAHSQWAMYLYETENYAKAAEEVAKAQALDSTSVPQSFLQALRAKTK